MSNKLQAAFVQTLLDHVEDDRYPSSTMMDVIEQRLPSGELRERYVEMLIDKLAEDRFPSPTLMQRVMRLVG